MNTIDIGSIAIFLVFNIIATVFLKKGFDAVGDIKFTLDYAFKWLFNPLIFISLALAMLCRLLYYRLQGGLGATGTFLVLGGLTYPTIIIANWLILGESLSGTKILASILIIAGILLLGVK